MLSEYSEYSTLGLDYNINILPNEELFGTLNEKYIENNDFINDK